MIKNKKHINPSDYIKKYRRGGLVPLFQGGGDMDPGMYDPNANIYMPDWQMDENVQLYDENADVNNSNENITDDGIILDEGELQCQMCDGGFPINVAPVNGACPEGSIPDDGKTNPCDAEKTEDAENTEEQTEGSQDTHITKTERGAPGWHTPDPYDIGPYGEPGDLFHLMGTIHGMGTDLGLWNPGFRGDDTTTTTTTVPGQEGQEEEIQGEDVVCQACDNGYPINVASVDGKCPPGSSPDDGTNPCDKSESTDSETDTNKEKDTDEEISFDEAFAAARTAGKDEFTWNGKKYNTKTKEEVDAEKDQKTLDALKEGIKPPQSQFEIDIQNERDRILSGDDQWWNTGANVPDTDGDGIPDTVDSANEYIWSQMYGGSTPYFQGGGTIDQAEYEQDQRQKDAANIADTLDLQGPNTNYLASMNANPNATDQPFIGPQLPNLDPDGDGINTGIDATPEGTDPNFIGPQPQPTPDLDPDKDNLNIGIDATPFGDDGPNFNPQDNESDDEGGDIACQKCEDGYPMNVAPVDGQCPEGSTPDDGSDPCAGQPAPKDEETDEGPQEETTEETKEEGEKQPFKPFRAAIKAAEFVNAWSRKRADRKKKKQAMLETSADYVFGDQATEATNKGQYDVNTGRMQPDKQVYARQGKYGIELPKAGYGWGDLWDDIKGAGKFVSNASPAGIMMNTYADTKADYDAGNIKSTDDLWSRGANNFLDNTQQGLQGAGFIPGWGAGADLVNAGISKTRAHFEDDPVKKAQYNIDAGTNLVSAIPGFGDAVGAGATLDMVTGSNVRNQLAQDYVDSQNKSTPVPTETPSIAKAEIEKEDEYIPQSQRAGRYGKELRKASMGLEWLKNNYPGFHDLTPDQQKQVLNQYSSNSQSQNTSGFSQQYLDTQKYKDEQRTLGYDPVISDLPSWLRKTKEGFGRVIIDDEMEKRMRGQLAGGKLDPQVAEEYARFLSSYRGPAAIDYNIDKYNRFQGYDADKQSRFNYPGVAFGYKDDLPGKGAWDTVSGKYSPNTLAAWMQLADQVNQPKKYKDLDEESIIAKDQKQFNKMLNRDFRNIEDDFLDDDYDMSLAYIPEDIEEEENPFGPEGFADVDQDLMNRLNRPNDEIVSLPTKTIDQIPTASIDQLPTRSTSVQKNTKSAYDFSGENPYEYGTDEYYNWKKAKRAAMFADEEPKKKPTKKENKRAEMFADAYVPQSQRAYGGEELDLDAKTIRKLIALGADIEIL